MDKKSMIIVVIILLFQTLLVFSEANGETFVLIMGAADYRNSGIIPLPAAKKDALLVKETLIELGVANEKNITYIEDPVLTDIKIGLREFVEKGKEADKLIFYFAGHSEVAINERGKEDTYLCGIDVRKTYIQETAYNFREHFEKLSEVINAQETIMIFDTCYAGGMTKERNLDILRIENKSFEAISQTKGINFLFSSGPDETSQEIGGEQGGWFTYYLIEGLKGEANLDSDDYISLKELSIYVQQKVQQTTQSEQNPMSMIVQEDIRLLRDQRKKYDDTLKKIMDAHFDGKLEYERFQRFGKILKQKESQDTQEDAKIRQILLNYNTLPTLGIEYVIMATNEFFEKQQNKTSIKIETIPMNADIDINGKYIGTSPVTIELEEGIHIIEAKKDGYITKTTNKTINKQIKNMSKAETISLILEKDTGSFFIKSNPSGAKITVKFEEFSFTKESPAIFTGLKEGLYEVKVEKEGYNTETFHFRINEEKNIEKTIQLSEQTEEREIITFKFVNGEPPLFLYGLLYEDMEDSGVYSIHKTIKSTNRTTIVIDNISFENAAHSTQYQFKFEILGDEIADNYFEVFKTTGGGTTQYEVVEYVDADAKITTVYYRNSNGRISILEAIDLKIPETVDLYSLKEIRVFDDIEIENCDEEDIYTLLVCKEKRDDREITVYLQSGMVELLW